MTAIGLQPITLQNAALTIASDDYTAAIGEVTFTPEVDYEWRKSMRSAHYEPRILGVRWVCMLTYAQDFMTAGALGIYLVEHAAQVKTVTFTPTAGGRTVTASVLIVPGQFGGRAQDGVLTANVTLPLFGEPMVT